MPVDMSDFEGQRPSSGPPLRVDTLLDELSPEHAKALRKALSEPDKYGSRLIARTVRQWGHSLSETAVDNWRERNRA